DVALLILRRQFGRQRSANAPWRHALDGFRREGQFQCSDQHCQIAGCRLCRFVAADDRLDHVDRMSDLLQMPDERGDDEGLSHVRSGGGDENCGHDKAPHYHESAESWLMPAKTRTNAFALASNS